MSYKEEFYNKIGKFNVEQLKSFFEKEGYTFDQFKNEYQSFKSEEERYKKRLEKLNMEQTAISVIMEQCKAEQITDAELGKWVRTAIYMLHEQEREQFCKMYIQGREDNHLDYYPKKHANETYVEFFGNGE